MAGFLKPIQFSCQSDEFNYPRDEFNSQVDEFKAKVTNSFANETNSIAKATNSIAKTCNLAFLKCKAMLMCDAALVHYDSAKPIKLACGAFSYGLGAVLSHVCDDGEHPISFVSRTLTKADRNYSHTEKEALVLVFRVKSFTNTYLRDPFPG